MAQEYQDNEELDFTQSGGGKWIKVIGIIVFIAIILAYAWQTLQLVQWLFPDSNWFMQAVTVFVCDGCATGYAMAEMFYRFRLRTSKQIVFGMWIITFVFSTVASVIQMYLSSTHNIPHSINATVISVAYGVVIAAFVANIVAITLIIRMEHNAGQPKHRYLDDKPKKKYPQRVVIDSPLLDSQNDTFARAGLAGMSAEDIIALARKGQQQVESQTDSFSSARLDTHQASQPSQNGHHN